MTQPRHGHAIKTEAESCFALDAFGFQRRKEALHRRVVPDVAGSLHASNDAAVSHQALELLAGVLAAPIRMGVKGASACYGNRKISITW